MLDEASRYVVAGAKHEDDPLAPLRRARAKKRKEIEEMSKEPIETEIKRTEVAMTERIESAARRKQGLGVGRLPWMMMVLGLIGGQSRPPEAFTAYDCSNRSNIVES